MDAGPERPPLPARRGRRVGERGAPRARIFFRAVELMRTAASLAFVAFARALNSLDGQIFVFFVMTVAAAEVAGGLADLVELVRLRGGVVVDEVNLLKG